MDKRCEICNKPLTGKQTRFCSIRCRNVKAGRASGARYQPVDRDWLAGEYLLPPEGKGRTLGDLGNEIGVSEVTLRKWLQQYGLTQDPRERLVAFAKLPHLGRRIQAPPREELAELYLMPPYGAGKSGDELCVHYQVSRPTIRRWLKEYGLEQTHSERHSARMSGESNPAFVNGNSHRYVRGRLSKVKPKVCEWCGATKNIQIHHIDHDHGNSDLSNLMWLCRSCNRLESDLWQLQRDNRIKVHHEENRLVIEFVGERT